MDLEVALSRIEFHVEQIFQDWNRVKGLLLTESDLQCLLFSRISSDALFSQATTTADEGVLATMVHSEVSWFGTDQKENLLSIKPDLTILEPRNLSLAKNLYDSELNLPSKGFSFQGKAIVIEIKFHRSAGRPSRTFVSEFNEDLSNLNKLINKFKLAGEDQKVLGIQITFDRGNNSDYFSGLTGTLLATENRLRFLYKCL